MTDYTVEIQPDFLERQAKVQPIAAVAELKWNGLDADSTAITVDLEDDNLGGLSRIIVTDNGHGIPYAEAPALFGNLGGSWKKRGAHTKIHKRQLHGQEGRGRFKAFALGSVVDWTSTYARDVKLFRYEITILDRDIRRVRIIQSYAANLLPSADRASAALSPPQATKRGRSACAPQCRRLPQSANVPT